MRADARAEVEGVVEPPGRPRAQRRRRPAPASSSRRAGSGATGAVSPGSPLAQQAVDRGRVQILLGAADPQRRVGLDEHAVAGRDGVRSRACGPARPATSRSWLPATRVPGGAQPGRAERALGAARGGRDGGAGRRRAGSTPGPGRSPAGRRRSRARRCRGRTRPPSSARFAPGHLVRLGVVDEVAVDDDRVGPGGVERADGGASRTWSGERLLRAEGRRRTAAPRRSRNDRRAGDSSSRTWVSVSCRTSPSTRPGVAAGGEVRPVAQRLARPALRATPSPSGSTSVARRVEPSAAAAPGAASSSRTPRRARPRRRRTS